MFAVIFELDFDKLSLKKLVFLLIFKGIDTIYPHSIRGPESAHDHGTQWISGLETPDIVRMDTKQPQFL